MNQSSRHQAAFKLNLRNFSHFIKKTRSIFSAPPVIVIFLSRVASNCFSGPMFRFRASSKTEDLLTRKHDVRPFPGGMSRRLAFAAGADETLDQGFRSDNAHIPPSRVSHDCELRAGGA